jgi:pimeloyl-ACP methyl ester carboxylesterase
MMRIAKIVLAAFAAVVAALVGFVYLAPETATRLAIESDRSRAGLARKEVVLPDGLHSVYLEGGQGEPLVLLHGFGANKDTFNRAAAFLTPHYRVIVPDLLGFGESDHPQDADYAPSAQAERVHALAQKIGLKNFHLGGSSMGGHIALTYAARFPADVQSLWLLDSGGIWTAPLAEPANSPIFVKSSDDLAKALAFYMSEPPFIPGPMLKVLAQERIRNQALEQRILKQITGDSIEARIAGMATPTLIVWGAQDRALNVATADILRKLLPHSQVIVMPGIGHLPMLEKAQQTAEDYLRFRAGLGAPSSAAGSSTLR